LLITNRSVINYGTSRIVSMIDKTKIKNTRKFQRRADARPDEVLDAALVLFMREGYEATRVEDIAKLAGISKATVYLYFTSKLSLLEGLVQRSLSPVALLAEKSIDEFEGSGQEAIGFVLRLVCEKMSDPNVYAIPAIIMREANRFPSIAQMYFDEVISHALPALRSVVEKGIVSGEFRDVDPELTIRNIVGPIAMHMLAASVFGMGDTSPEGLREFLKNHLDILFNGLNKEA